MCVEDCLCESLCVTGDREAEAAGGGGGSGLKNQKQEPHRMMWRLMRLTRAQNPCLLSIILTILLNSVSRGTRLAEDFWNASRSHRLPRWRISPPGTRVLSSQIVFTSISCSICLRSDLGYGDHVTHGTQPMGAEPTMSIRPWYIPCVFYILQTRYL